MTTPLVQLRRTLCNRDCPDTCSIVAHVEVTDDRERVVRLEGEREHPITRGFLCHRTSRFLTTQYAPSRITRPLVRGDDGVHRPISWEHALDLAAERLLAIARESGPAAIFHYRSGGTLGILAAVVDRLFALFGPVTVKRGDICSGAGEAAQELDFGACDSNDVFDLRNARSILLWGKNVACSSPHLLPILREARGKGARVVLVDPVHHKTTAHADAFIQPRPAADFALAMAVASSLFAHGWVDPNASSWCEGLDRFRALVASRSSEAWRAEADVSREEVESLARALGVEKPCTILVGWGMGRRRNGGAIVRALDALAAITGNIGVPGAGVSFYFKRRGAFDLSFASEGRAPPRTICEPLFGPELLAAKDPPIRAVWITAGNPVAMLPESETTSRALRSREFVVVVDSFMTDTARLAHLVLPTTTLLEADDLLGSYGHHQIGVARPVVTPPGECKQDFEIARLLAARLGVEGMEGSARDWKERALSKASRAAGVTLEKLEAGPTKNPLAKEILFEGRVFPTPSGKARLIDAAPPSSASDAAFPLLLMSLSTERSQSSQWIRDAAGEELGDGGPALVTIHPDTANGLADGALARLESAIGALTVRVKHDPRQRRDVALLPKGGRLRDGTCANVLIRAETSDLGEGGALYDERVRIVDAAKGIAIDDETERSEARTDTTA